MSDVRKTSLLKRLLKFTRSSSHHVDTKKDLGHKGEEIAAQYLQKQGFKIIERNYRHRRGEIDIVAREGKTLVFIEVKTAASTQYGPPESWVGFRKQKQVAKMAEAYLQERHLTHVDCRFDVIAVDTTRDNGINHIQNAFWIKT